MKMIDKIISQFIDYYSEIDMRSPHILNEIYHPDVVLIDPFGVYFGLNEFKKALSPLVLNINVHYLLIDEPLRNDHSFAMTWTLYWSHPALTFNETKELNGCTYAKIYNEKIISQENYYDLGEFLYEKIPLLKCAIKKIKLKQNK
ncbi:nuclear transport factor 2 family protein [Enterobacter roggenkampii]|uniref:nuclear transport factor 2 family protein n=1 Tax=Enterobacter roggenkampii TaxID=1812935 RepID=UPI002FF74F2D